MLRTVNPPPDAQGLPPAVHVVCLCVASCRLCDDYAPIFQRVTAALQTPQRRLQVHWLDIEDEAALLGEMDVETFPTIVVVAEDGVRFAGALTPQPETLQRVLSAVLVATPAPTMAPAVLAFAQRLRQRGN